MTPPVDLRKARAHWLDQRTIGWRRDLPPDTRFVLHQAPMGGLEATGHGIVGGRDLPLGVDTSGLSAPLRGRFPHLADLLSLRVPDVVLGELPALLKGQLALSAVSAEGALLDATSLQLPGVLDDLFAYAGPLGVAVGETGVTLRLWAPTARAVRLHLFESAGAGTPMRVMEMAPDRGTGTWSAHGDGEWTGRFYLYEVEVFVWRTGRVERNLVTDPYSLSLAANSRRSQIVSLDDPALKPAGWDQLGKPPLGGWSDITLYELHLRDFSASDPDVPAPLRGTFRAFTLDSFGTRHLRRLAEAGLSHVHLLPIFDVASLEEERSAQAVPEGLRGHPPDSRHPQAVIGASAARDAFNWGYDPFHYLVPEGGYSTDPDGPARIREVREMVQALAGRGLRVVMDVVFNHTYASGQSRHAVLDRVVPGYYHRLNWEGEVEKSSCCDNTATEHAMMERLMVDAVVTWARAYKVDGFRFDLMGHHMKDNMLRVRAALDALTPAADGVDGRALFVYGEGWDFGEVQGGQRGENATQRRMTGTGIATFNDRLRDAARGGSAFGPVQDQGLVTGLADAPNAAAGGSDDDRRGHLLLLQDRIRVGLAGGVASFTFTDRAGRPVRADEIDYNGQPAGYTAAPWESVNYVEAHDNETLWDAIALKAPVSLPVAERVRMQNLGLSLVALAQGVPFFHAGMEMLRSKSLDRNSYDSGDWFNRLDYTCESNNWGVGLPPERDNRGNWPLQAALLANPLLRPGPDDIRRAVAHFEEVLRIRRSSPLFRLRDAEAVSRHLAFLNCGPAQAAGLVVLVLRDPGGTVDPERQAIVVLFNARANPVDFEAADLRGLALDPHPVQAASGDARLREARWDVERGVFHVPGRTTAVFEARR